MLSVQIDADGLDWCEHRCMIFTAFTSQACSISSFYIPRQEHSQGHLTNFRKF
jgi:hypothetical protein